MKSGLCLILAGFALAIVMPTEATAKDKYWQPQCAEGAVLEQRKRKPEFRCRREGGLVAEYHLGKCQRPMKLRKVTGQRYDYLCLGTTIGAKGDAGVQESMMNYECRPGYKKNFNASKPGETCERMVPGSVFEKPIF